MADASSFPQIPATVWWGVRDILSKTPKAALNENYLSAQLNVQKTAARQYLNELKRIGILNDENKATEVALQWRLDDTYPTAVAHLVSSVYGEDLPNLASGLEDRDKAVTWFKTQGLGEGSAKNKAATYFLVTSQIPGEAITRSSSSAAKRPVKTLAPKVDAFVDNSARSERAAPGRESQMTSGLFPVNLNIQIHISADASTDQIDAIFASMRKHLGNAQLT